MKNPATLLLGAALCISMAAGAEVIEPNSVYPAPGVVEKAGTINLFYPSAPSVNRQCATPAVYTKDGKMKNEVLPTSGMVQMGNEGMSANQVLICFVSAPDSEDGEYTITLPEGFFTFNEGADVSAAMTLKYTIMPTARCQVSPATGYFTEIPTMVTVTFPDAQSVVVNPLEKNEDGRGVILFDTPTDQLEPDNVIVKGNKVMLMIPSTEFFTAKGNYSIELPFGAFTVTLADGTERTNAYTLVHYYIPVVPYPKASPAPGNVTDLTEITLYWDEEDEVTFDRLMITPSLYTFDNGVKGERIGIYPCTTNQLEVRGHNSLTFRNTAGDFRRLGSYRFIMSRSGFSANGYLDDENPDIKTVLWSGCDFVWDYNIVPALSTIESTYEESEPTFGEVETLEFKLPYATTAELHPEAVAEVHDMFDRKLPYEVLLTLEETGTRADNGFTLRADIFPAITKNGFYTLIIPAGAVTVNGTESSPVAFLDFNVDSSLTGMGDIATEGTVDVYSIDGRIVAKAMPVSALSSLPKGIYIAGGKKIKN